MQFTCTLFDISLDNIIDFIQTIIEVLLDEGTLVPHILDEALGQGVHRGQQGLVVPALAGGIGRQARSHALGHPVHQVISLHTLGHDTLGHFHATQDRPELLVHGNQSDEVCKLARPAQLVILGRVDAGQGIVLLLSLIPICTLIPGIIHEIIRGNLVDNRVENILHTVEAGRIQVIHHGKGSTDPLEGAHLLHVQFERDRHCLTDTVGADQGFEGILTTLLVGDLVHQRISADRLPGIGNHMLAEDLPQFGKTAV